MKTYNPYAEVKHECLLRALKALGLFILNFYMVRDERGSVRVLRMVIDARIEYFLVLV